MARRHAIREVLQGPLLFAGRQPAPVGDQLLELGLVGEAGGRTGRITDVGGRTPRGIDALGGAVARFIAAVGALIAVARRAVARRARAVAGLLLVLVLIFELLDDF